MKFFLIVLHSLCQIFHMEMFRGLFSVRFVFWEIISTEGGISGVAKKPIYRLKSYSNEKMLRRIFQDELSTSNFTERGDSQRGKNCLEGI